MKISEILAPGEQKPIENDINRLQDERDRLLQRARELDAELEDRYDQSLADERREVMKQLYDNEAQLRSATTLRPDDKLWHMLKTQCSEILQILKAHTGSGWMLRGMKNTPGPVFQGRGWNNRISKDSSATVSKVFNYCLQQLGFAARRDNSTFVTSRSSLAQEFGEIYMIFPKNGFQFTYTIESDVVLKPDYVNAMVDITKVRKTQEFLQELQKDPKTELQAEIVSTAGATSVIGFITNIMKYSDTEIAQFFQETDVNLDWRQFVDLEKFQQTWEPSNKDVHVALQTGKEIYIQGEYIALHYATFRRSIAYLIQNDL